MDKNHFISRIQNQKMEKVNSLFAENDMSFWFAYPFANMNITPVKPLAESDKISFALERKVQTNNTQKMTIHGAVKLPWVYMNVNGEETNPYIDVSSFRDRCSEMVCVRGYELRTEFEKLDFRKTASLAILMNKLLQKDDSPFSEENVIPKSFTNIEIDRLESWAQIHKLRQAPAEGGNRRAVLIKYLEAVRDSLETESYSYNTVTHTVTLNPDTVVEVDAPTNEEEVAATNEEAEIANVANEKAKVDAEEQIARRSVRQAELRNQRIVPEQSNFLQQHDEGLRQTTMGGAAGTTIATTSPTAGEGKAGGMGGAAGTTIDVIGATTRATSTASPSRGINYGIKGKAKQEQRHQRR
jgi:hypothetical protein